MVAENRVDPRDSGKPLNRIQTEQNGRDESGRFTKGAKPGPGRPRKDRTKKAWSGEELVQRALELRAINDAWKSIIELRGHEVARRLKLEAQAEGVHVPSFVDDLIEAARQAEEER